MESLMPELEKREKNEERTQNVRKEDILHWALKSYFALQLAV